MLMVASTEILRQQNRALVLTALRASGPVSHTEIASKTRLSSATVSAITSDLESEAIIRRLEPNQPTGRGRPRVLFRLNENIAFVAIVRITSDAVEYSLTDYVGTLKDRFSEPRPQQGDTVDRFIERLNSGLLKLRQRSQLDTSQIMTISITSKGVVAAGRPLLLWSPVFGDQSIDFHAALASDWQAQITLTNETLFAAQAFAFRHRTSHPVTATRKTAVLSLGNSIGLGICSEEPGGRTQSVSPSFGHMVHRTDGPLCRCGEHGCVEAYAGFYGILRTALDAPEAGIPVSQVPLTTLDAISRDARAGDLRAEFAFRTAAEALGIGLSRVLSLFGEMPVILTGPGVRYLDLMQPTIEQFMRQNLYLRNQPAAGILVELEESNLIYEGNVSSCMSDLDRNSLALGVKLKVST